jgi:hypothetical protein
MVAMVEGEQALVALADGSIVRVEADRCSPEVMMGVGAQVTIAVRPEQLQRASGDAPGTIGGTVVSARVLGIHAEYVLDVGGRRITVRRPSGRLTVSPGDWLRVAISPDGAYLLP